MAQPLDNPGLSPEEEQEKFKNEAIKQVAGNAFQMKRALDKCNLHEALKYSAQMLGELRTSLLSPQKYYELYIKVFDELQHLEQYFFDEVRRGTRVEELYEVVQHAGNIVPRMYLLITVGSVYIKSKEAAAKDILRDLVEMCKGVQHPTRGLFLRNYLSQMAKNKLPDTGNEYEGEVGGTVHDSVEFILQNFHEMVRLWVRMETKGIVRDKDKREKERKELRVLVGFNLVRLSQLDGVDLSMYEKLVLNRILEIIIQCKDQLAQQYLMECIIQVFPDEFHVATLESFLDSCMLLHLGVDLRNIFTVLMDRLAKFASTFTEGSKARDPSIETSLRGMTPLFLNFIQKAVQERPKMMTQPVIVQILISLLNLALKSNPGDLNVVNSLFGVAAELFEQSKEKKLESQAVKLLKRFILLPFENYQNVVVCLQLDKLGELLQTLPYQTRREAALEIAQCASKYGHKLDSLDTVNKLFGLLSPLIHDEADQPPFDEIYANPEELAEDQSVVSRLVHLFYNDSIDVLFKMYSSARKQFGTGGEQRFKYTLVPLVFAYLKLAMRMHVAKDRGEECSTPITKVIGHVLDMLTVLWEHIPELVLKLYLQTGATADYCALEDQSYEAFTQALVLYEEKVVESKIQLQTLTILVGTLQSLRNLSDTNYETLATKACQYSSKLLKKPDQCQAAYLCSHLFWSTNRQDGNKVLECLQRSLKIVDGCMAAHQIQLFVQILSEYLYYFNANNDKVTVKYLNVLLELINTNMGKSEEDTKPDTHLAPVSTYYSNTLRYIEAKQRSGPEPEKWKGILTRT